MPDPTPPLVNAQPQPPPQPMQGENQPAPIVQPETQNTQDVIPQNYTPDQAVQGARHGILSALMPEYKYETTPQGVQKVPVQTSPGDAFRRIVAGALVGMGAGAANPGHPGAGILGGIGTGGTAVMNRDRANDQLARQNAEQDYRNQQQKTLNDATIAHLGAETARYAWQTIREQGSIDQQAADELNKMRDRVSADPRNKSYGEFASFDDFLKAHQDNAQDFSDKMARGLIQPVTVYSGGKPTGVEVFEVNPAWADQKNSDPVKIPYVAGTDNKGKPQVAYKTIPAGGITNGDAWKAETSLGVELLKGAVTPKDVFHEQNENVRTTAKEAGENARAQAHEAGENERAGEKGGQKATADETRRADLANNMNENLDQLEDILKRRPELFGPVAGRMTQAKGAVGTSDPDVATLAAIKEQMGMAMVGAHAMRNAQHVETAANAIVNGYKNDPTAVSAAIKAARQSLQTFINDKENKGGEGKPDSNGFFGKFGGVAR